MTMAPDNNRLLTPKDIILVHGLYQTSFVMKVLGNRLASRGYRVHYFKYATLKKTLSTNVEAFLSFLESFNQPYAIIGHSLGCLLTLKALQKKSQAHLKAFIAITPPFKGARIVQYLAKHDSDFLVGKSAADLLPQNLDLRWDQSIPLGVIAGTDHSGPTVLLLERLTNTIPKNSLAGDGTVYLDETKIPGLTDFTALDKTHTMILFDKRLPILCDTFLQTGRFPKVDSQ